MTARDPERHPVSYYIDWGDGTTTGWSLLNEHDIPFRFGHKWHDQGFFKVRVKARDSPGLESNWSEPIVINMTTEISVKNRNRLFYISTIIQNKGQYDIHNVEWKIHISGLEDDVLTYGPDHLIIP